MKFAMVKRKECRVTVSVSNLLILLTAYIPTSKLSLFLHSLNMNPAIDP
jgi:hypothetical protein